MGALPKHKTSSYKKGLRRQDKQASTQQYMSCPQCKSPKLPHHACSSCGTYKSN